MRERLQVDELMDDPLLAAEEHDLALAGLARLNAFSGSRWLLWNRIAALAEHVNAEGRPLEVLDLATGSGDGPLAMAQHARRRSLRIQWTLCDVSVRALTRARQRADRAGVHIRTTQCDVRASRLPCTADVVTCSLFTHHCTRSQASILMRRMADMARIAVGVTDLERNRRGFALAWLGSRLLTHSRIVHFDALASVRAAYTLSEARELAHEAGLRDAHVERAWPARWRLWWRRP